MTKWIVFALVLGALVLLMVLPKKSVKAELEISASPDAIWAVLIDSAGYPDWNPIFVSVEGDFSLDSEMKIDMKMNGEVSKVTAKVINRKDLEWLNQKGGYPGILTYSHNWQLEPTETGTLVTQFEVYRGFYVLFWDPAPVEKIYEQSNQQLKARVER